MKRVHKKKVKILFYSEFSSERYGNNKKIQKSFLKNLQRISFYLFNKDLIKNISFPSKRLVEHINLTLILEKNVK